MIKLFLLLLLLCMIKRSHEQYFCGPMPSPGFGFVFPAGIGYCTSTGGIGNCQPLVPTITLGPSPIPPWSGPPGAKLCGVPNGTCFLGNACSSPGLPSTPALFYNGSTGYCQFPTGAPVPFPVGLDLLPIIPNATCCIFSCVCFLGWKKSGSFFSL